MGIIPLLIPLMQSRKHGEFVYSYTGNSQLFGDPEGDFELWLYSTGELTFPGNWYTGNFDICCVGGGGAGGSGATSDSGALLGGGGGGASGEVVSLFNHDLFQYDTLKATPGSGGGNAGGNGERGGNGSSTELLKGNYSAANIILQAQGGKGGSAPTDANTGGAGGTGTSYSQEGGNGGNASASGDVYSASGTFRPRPAAYPFGIDGYTLNGLKFGYSGGGGAGIYYDSSKGEWVAGTGQRTVGTKQNGCGTGGAGANATHSTNLWNPEDGYGGCVIIRNHR